MPLRTHRITLFALTLLVGLIDVPTPANSPKVIYLVKKQKDVNPVVKIETMGGEARVPGVGVPEVFHYSPPNLNSFLSYPWGARHHTLALASQEVSETFDLVAHAFSFDCADIC